MAKRVTESIMKMHVLALVAEVLRDGGGDQRALAARTSGGWSDVDDHDDRRAQALRAQVACR